MIVGVIAIVGLGMTLRSLDIKDCGTVISCDNGYEQRHDLLVRAFNGAIQDVELNGLVMPASVVWATTLPEPNNAVPMRSTCGGWDGRWG